MSCKWLIEHGLSSTCSLRLIKAFNDLYDCPTFNTTGVQITLLKSLL
jgi:hypothetical protein